ncbi:hypothetical protein J7L67_07180, partial [bacterium]|nr:hypothetical protein [bacterium]
SKSLVKTRWFFCSILMMIITLFPVVFAVIGQRAGNNFFIILLFTVINAVIASFCSVLYMIYFLNFEKLNGISQAE